MAADRPKHRYRRRRDPRAGTLLSASQPPPASVPKNGRAAPASAAPSVRETGGGEAEKAPRTILPSGSTRGVSARGAARAPWQSLMTSRAGRSRGALPRGAALRAARREGGGGPGAGRGFGRALPQNGTFGRCELYVRADRSEGTGRGGTRVRTPYGGGHAKSTVRHSRRTAGRSLCRPFCQQEGPRGSRPSRVVSFFNGFGGGNKPHRPHGARRGLRGAEPEGLSARQRERGVEGPLARPGSPSRSLGSFVTIKNSERHETKNGSRGSTGSGARRSAGRGRAGGVAASPGAALGARTSPGRHPNRPHRGQPRSRDGASPPNRRLTRPRAVRSRPRSLPAAVRPPFSRPAPGPRLPSPRQPALRAPLGVTASPSGGP